jgi:drug/metabolite transporter (DMT)-like permease
VVELAMLLHSAISAGTYLAAKRALAELSPFEVALARFVLAGAVYAALLLARPPRVARRDLAGLAALGFVAIPLNQGLFLGGLSLTTPGHAALLYATTPVFVFLIGAWRGEERATPRKLAGIGVAFAGVAVVLASRGQLSGAGDARAGLAGDVLVLLAVMAWAVYVVFGKAYVGRYGVVTTTGLTVVIGTLLYVPLGLAVSREASFRAVSPVGWASVAYLVILTSVVAYLVYYWSLARAEASRVAIWSNTQPVLTALLAWAIHGDPLTGAFVAGGALVIAGVALTQRA